MNKIEYVRRKLYNVIETGDKESILKISQELDMLIAKYIKLQLRSCKKYAS
ncbi:MAG: Spo0E family sporulation regulatory protein-aspartic acid phosphatase [Clostridiaceae bacterium]|nr:Spo0E family sporulation regulatory protein-aspartic acid phosphatase [Clostridiaceae bacterium]